MKCAQCGGKLGPVKLADYTYRGLPGVVLVDIQTTTCLDCGELEYSLPRFELLNATLVRLVVDRPERLGGPEIRFLRGYLGWSGRELAVRVGVTAETVSRWENSALEIGETPDKVIRMFAILHAGLDDVCIANFDRIAKLPPKRLELRLAANPAWAVVVAQSNS